MLSYAAAAADYCCHDAFDAFRYDYADDAADITPLLMPLRCFIAYAIDAIRHYADAAVTPATCLMPLPPPPLMPAMAFTLISLFAAIMPCHDGALRATLFTCY